VGEFCLLIGFPSTVTTKRESVTQAVFTPTQAVNEPGIASGYFWERPTAESLRIGELTLTGQFPILRLSYKLLTR
jgi:hypothetical protein